MQYVVSLSVTVTLTFSFFADGHGDDFSPSCASGIAPCEIPGRRRRTWQDGRDGPYNIETKFSERCSFFSPSEATSSNQNL